MKLNLIVGIVALLGAASLGTGAELQNLARGKTVSFSIPPSYPLCTDDGDATDLTDGIRSGQKPDSGYWTEKSTVGWQHSRAPVAFTIDLGKVEPIAGALFASAGGGAGVCLPSSIAVLVSENGNDFYDAGDLVRLSETPWPAEYGEFAKHDFRTTALQTKGRYVRFVANPASIFLFTDEIEVYRGDETLLAASYRGKPVDEKELIDPLRLTQLGVYRRTRADLEKVQAMTQEPALTAELKTIAAELDKQQFPNRLEGFRAVAPLNDLHARILAVRGQVLGQQTGQQQPLVLWHTPPYQLLEMFAKPEGTLDRLELKMMSNEWRAEVFNLTNASAKPIEAKFSIDGLPGGTNPSYIEPHQVEYADTRERKWVASALVKLEPRGQTYVTTVPAGMTRQIWLSVHPTSKQAGKHSGQISISAEGFEKKIPFDLTVAALEMPRQLDCSLAMYDYAVDNGYEITDGNRKAAIDDMQRHFVDSPWCMSSSIPQPQPKDLDPQGNLIGKIDYSRWDAFVKAWPGAKHYVGFLAVHDDSGFAGLVHGSEAFERGIAQWAAEWAKHNRAIGLKSGQANILFLDEPGGPSNFKTTLAFAKPFKAATKEILIYCDPTGTTTMNVQGARAALEQCDIISPPEGHYARGGEPLAAFYRELTSSQGRQLWMYDCSGPTKQFDPSYFRYQPWNALAAGAKGVQFWAYGDAGGCDSFNEYAAVGQGSFTPVYLSPRSVTTSKHWEAAREGLEDYQYVVMLRQRAADDKLAQDLPAKVATELRKQYGVDFPSGWRNQSALAEQARQEVLSVLMKSKD